MDLGRDEIAGDEIPVKHQTRRRPGPSGGAVVAHRRQCLVGDKNALTAPLATEAVALLETLRRVEGTRAGRREIVVNRGSVGGERGLEGGCRWLDRGLWRVDCAVGRDGFRCRAAGAGPVVEGERGRGQGGGEGEEEEEGA